MNQAILQSNEFIVKVEATAEGLKISIRNPHIELGQDGEYDLGALEMLKALMVTFKTHQ